MLISDHGHSRDGRISVKLSSINLRHSSLVPFGPRILHPAGRVAPASQTENIPASLTTTKQAAVGVVGCRRSDSSGSMRSVYMTRCAPTVDHFAPPRFG